MKYYAFFRIYSEYENFEENINSQLIIELESESINEIQYKLRKIEEEMEWDDSNVINFNAKSRLICTTSEIFKLIDEKNNEVNQISWNS